MAIVSAAQLDALRVGFNKNFNDGLRSLQADQTYGKIATVVPSSTGSNTYGMLGQFPKMRKWVGDRVIKSLKESGYSIQNDTFEDTVGVARTDIEDDNLGMYATLMQGLGKSCAELPEDLVYEALAAGFETNCYDGQYFFDTDHPIYENVDGTGAVTTVSNMQAGDENPWFLLDTSKSLKPLIYQDRIKAELVARTSSDDEHVFNTDEFLYGARARGAAGYGLWQMAYGSKAQLTVDNFDAAYDAMCALKADGGNRLKVMPTILVVGTSNRVAAEHILMKERNDSGATNTNFKRVELLVTNQLD